MATNQMLFAKHYQKYQDFLKYKATSSHDQIELFQAKPRDLRFGKVARMKHQRSFDKGEIFKRDSPAGDESNRSAAVSENIIKSKTTLSNHDMPVVLEKKY